MNFVVLTMYVEVAVISPYDAAAFARAVGHLGFRQRPV